MREDLLKQYAEFAVKVGVNPQKGQTMLISCSVESAPFARLCAQAAFEAGARDVVMKYTDEQIARIRMENASVETLEDVKPYILRSYLDYAESEGGACILNIHDSDPEVFKGLDAQKIARANKARREALAAWRDYTMKDKVQWSIVAIPGPAWAKKVFPGDENAEEKLWQAILETVRVSEDNDPMAEWEAHDAELKAHCEKLNALDLDHLHYQAPNGTDFKCWLIPGAQWHGGGDTLPDGTFFDPNMPTEEVFTSPMRGRCEGTLVSTMPLSYQGNLIDKFSVTFENGRVVSCQAEQGQALLERMVAMDEGAAMLGELALVPVESPIYQQGILFYNTLFDENAACHVALGRGFNEVIPGFDTMSGEELKAKGINDSIIHVDFMIGCRGLSITGVTRDGREVPIFRNGTWAL